MLRNLYEKNYNNKFNFIYIRLDNSKIFYKFERILNLT